MRKDLVVVDGTKTLLPVQIASAGDRAARRFVEFFTANYPQCEYEGILCPGGR
jgi:hypothetical protein